jgi:Winged helix DNA-binding domain
MRGKQHTYALVDERVAAPRRLSGDEALAELTFRFFTTHGPATVKDFAWWSSLTMTQIRRGLQLAGDVLRPAEVGGRTVWYDPATPAAGDLAPTALLLQSYDEYVIAYSDTKFVFNAAGLASDPARYPVNTMVHLVVVDSQVAGFWRRRPRGKDFVVELDLVNTPTPRQRAALDAELARHERFTGAVVAAVHV